MSYCWQKLKQLIDSVPDVGGGYERLVLIAQETLKQTPDIFHDYEHHQRIVNNLERIDFQDLKPEDKQLLVLVAWWHDLSRALFKKPHYLIMIFLDDILSAYYLNLTAKKVNLKNQIIKDAIKVLLCKSLLLGPWLKYFLLPGRLQTLSQIIFEIDYLDNLNPSRIKSFFPLVESKRLHRWEYKYAIFLFFQFYQLRGVKVAGLKPIAKNFFQQIVTWAEREEIKAWHIKVLSEKWYRRNLELAIKIRD